MAADPTPLAPSVRHGLHPELRDVATRLHTEFDDRLGASAVDRVLDEVAGRFAEGPCGRSSRCSCTATRATHWGPVRPPRRSRPVPRPTMPPVQQSPEPASAPAERGVDMTTNARGTS